MKSIVSAPARAAWASTTSGFPFFCSSPTDSSATRGRSTPKHRLAEGRAEVGELDQVLGADLGVRPDVEEEHRAGRPRTRSGGGDLWVPGRGTWAAKAGRWTPRSLFSANSAAVIVAPVDPALTMAAELPSATSAAAITTEAPGVERTAATGSASLAIQPPVGTTSTPSDASSDAGPKTRTTMPSAAAILAPSITTSGPESVP